MLQFRIRYLLDSRGIANPYNYLFKNGFTSAVSKNLIHDNQSLLKLSQVTKLCKLLKCTPNDLLKWDDTEEDDVPAGHPLLTLRRNDVPMDILGNINHLSLEQIREVHRFISTLNDPKV